MVFNSYEAEEVEDEIAQLEDHCRFLLELVPLWAREDVPSGLAEMYYGTGVERKDRAVRASVKAIQEMLQDH